MSGNNRGRGLGLCEAKQPRSEERLDLRNILFIRIKKKNTGWIFYHYKADMYKHCQHTFMFKHHGKVNFASDDHFKMFLLFRFFNNPGSYFTYWKI